MKDLTKGNTFKTLFLFSIPLLISGVVAQTYNLIDLIVAGKVIGSDALGATGCTTTFIQFLSSLFWGFGVASATVCGELYGAKEKGKIVDAINTALSFTGLMMFVLCLSCFAFSRQILTLLKVDEQIFDSALSYFRIYLIALFIQSMSYQTTSILPSLGNSKYPMFMNLLSGLANLILNIVFVVAFHSGVNGLAYASILSSLIAFILGFIEINKTIRELGGKFKVTINKEALKRTSVLAVPCILQQCSLYLSSVIVQPFVNGFGKEVSAGYSIAMNVNVLLNAIYHSVARSAASYTSQSKGAKEYGNFNKGVYLGVIIQVILTAPFALLILIFPNQFMSIFLKNNDPSVLPYATQYVKICIPFLFFVAYGNLMHSFYKSVESVKTVLVTTTIFTISRITLTYVIPNTELINAVYLALSLSWVIEGVLMFAIYHLGIWKSKEQKEYEKNRRAV